MCNIEEDSPYNWKDEILEIIRTRPNTNVAKCLQAYEDQPELSTLVCLLEEIGRNSDYSTDFRISLNHYLQCFLNHCLAQSRGERSATNRTTIVAAGNVLQSCSKIYSDRVEYLYQIVQQQIESLVTADTKKAETSGDDATTAKPPEAKKRRVKKLVQAEVDPYMITVETRKFKTMSSEKRFSTAGFVKCLRHRTVEYLYQDHIPPNIWKHAPIMDPFNPLELDEKKNYKLFTYHVEHRYNTLVPDILFERLNLIKGYLQSHELDVTDILHENLNTKDYLNEFIALENQVLESRYGATLRSVRKRKSTTPEPDASQKRARIDSLHEDADYTQPLSPRLVETEDLSRRDTLADSAFNETQVQDSSADFDMLNTQPIADTEDLSRRNTLADSAFNETQVQDSSADFNMLNSTSALNSTEFNESSVLESTRMGPDNNVSKPDVTDALQLVDSGVVVENLTDIQPTAQCSDDEGVVLSDLDDMRLLSPKVIVQDILPGVPNKSNLSVCIDEELLGLAGVSPRVTTEETTALVEFEEIMNVQRTERYAIKLNILKLPPKKLRKECYFKLTKEFDIFKQMRLPTKPAAEAKAPAVPKPAVVLPTGAKKTSLGIFPRDNASNAMSYTTSATMEYTKAGDFKGFNDTQTTVDRRSTFDSGVEFDQQNAIDVKMDLTTELDNPAQLDEIQEVRDSANDATVEPKVELLCTLDAQHQADGTLGTLDETSGVLTDTTENIACNTTNNATTELLETSTCAQTDDALGTLDDTSEMLTDTTENITPEASTCNTTLDVTTTEVSDFSAISQVSQEDLDTSYNELAGFSDTSVQVRNWHMRLAPALEAAHERQNFDIKSIGTEIIEACQAGNGEATLADVMESKNNSYLCRYMLASLVLTNQGNVSLNFGNRDKSKPIDMCDFKMKLLTTKRQEIHPEDDVGNIRMKAPDKNVKTDKSTNALKRKLADESQMVNLKTVRLIKPIKKVNDRPEEADSGISSLHTSFSYTSSSAKA